MKQVSYATYYQDELIVNFYTLYWSLSLEFNLLTPNLLLLHEWEMEDMMIAENPESSCQAQ